MSITLCIRCSIGPLPFLFLYSNYSYICQRVYVPMLMPNLAINPCIYVKLYFSHFSFILPTFVIVIPISFFIFLPTIFHVPIFHVTNPKINPKIYINVFTTLYCADISIIHEAHNASCILQQKYEACSKDGEEPNSDLCTSNNKR